MEMHDLGEQFVTSRSANALEDETANDIASKDHRPNHLPVANSMPQVIAEMPSRKIDFSRTNKANIYCTMRRPKYNTVRIQKAAMCQMRDHINETEVIEILSSDPEMNQSTPESEHLRMETIKQIHCSLPKKRNLKKTFSRKLRNSGTTLAWGPSMRFKLKQSYRLMRIKTSEGLLMIDLWHNHLKIIEGQFGRSTAYYFRFLQRLVFLNLIIFIISVLFILMPQLLWRVNTNSTDSTSDNISEGPNSIIFTDIRLFTLSTNSPYGYYNIVDEQTSSTEKHDGDDLAWTDFITGAGRLADTELYYGTYINITISSANGYFYNLPLGYLLATVAHLFICLFLLAKWVGSAYKKHISFSSAFGTHTFCNNVFCSWDFSITSQEAASFKQRGLLQELQEKLKSIKRLHTRLKFQKLCEKITRIVINHVIALGILTGSGALTWNLLTSNKLNNDNSILAEITLSLIITAILIVVPCIFSLLIRWEGYDEKVTEVCVTIIRMMLLLMTELGVLCYFWFKTDYENNGHGKSICWETRLGEEIYRLLLIDCIAATITSLLVGLIQTYLIRKKIFGHPEFDLAWNTWNLIYTQMLCWLGSFYFPMVSGIIIIKLLLTFYIKQLHVRINCTPPKKPWGTTQIKTIFLSYAFIGLVAMLIPVGYSIIAMTPSQNCGPFQGKSTVYQVILDCLDNYHLTSTALERLVSFITVPGCVAGILIVLCAITFQLKSHANATQHMVERMQHQLQLEGNDKIFLLHMLDATMKALEKVEYLTNNQSCSTTTNSINID